MNKIKPKNISNVKKIIDISNASNSKFNKASVNQLINPLQAENEKENSRNKIAIPDTRTIDAITKMPISKKAPLIADIDFMKQVVSSAKRNGIDPYTALAMAYQETNMGNGWRDNPFHVVNLQSENPIEESMALLKQKIEYGKRLGKKNEADLIQSWNGYGKISPKSEYNTNKYYGIDVSKTPIDMNTNPVYGKRVLDIRDNILKKHSGIVDIVNSVK